jgi:hypothetical protein
LVNTCKGVVIYNTGEISGFEIVKWSQLEEEPKMAKKSHLNTDKPAGQAEKKVPAVPTSYSTSWRDEEELVDYEPEDPPSFSPTEEALSDPEGRLRTPKHWLEDNSPPEDDFGANPAEDAAMAGQKRRRNF